MTDHRIQRISLMAKLEGAFLESLPVQAISTLTTPVPWAQWRQDAAFSDWIRGTQAHNRLTLGWVKATETKPRLHLHVALIAAAPIDCAHAAALWREMISPRFIGAARVEPYQNGLCGLGYVMKELGCPRECIQFSENIAHFATHVGRSHFKMKSAQRRQQRRIQMQIKQG